MKTPLETGVTRGAAVVPGSPKTQSKSTLNVPRRTAGVNVTSYVELCLAYSDASPRCCSPDHVPRRLEEP